MDLSPSQLGLGANVLILLGWGVCLVAFFYVVKQNRVGLFFLSLIIAPVFLVYPVLALIKLAKRKSEDRDTKAIENLEESPPWTSNCPFPPGRGLHTQPLPGDIHYRRRRGGTILNLFYAMYMNLAIISFQQK